MALKITTASEPITIDSIITVIYAAPGIGKTSLAFTADKPLLLDFDKGAHRAANRGDIVQIADWRDIAGITAEDLAPFNTVIVDTAGRALDVLSVDIIRANPKHGRGGALTLQGFGELKSRFTAFLKLLTSFGKDVVLIAHMDEQRSGDDLIERLDMQGGSKNEVYKAADAMGRLVITNGQRQLRFSPTDTSFGKNPGQLDPIDVPHITDPAFATILATVIRTTKDRMNELSEAQKAAMDEQHWFTEHLPAIEDADGINALLGRAKAAGRVASVLLNRRAEELGLHFDKGAGEYAPSTAEDGETQGEAA